MYFHPLTAREISDAFAHQQGEHGELLHSGAMHGVVLRVGEGQEVLGQGTYVLALVLGIKTTFSKMHAGQDMRWRSAAYLRCTFHDVLYATMSATSQEHDVFCLAHNQVLLVGKGILRVLLRSEEQTVSPWPRVYALHPSEEQETRCYLHGPIVVEDNTGRGLQSRVQADVVHAVRPE